MNADPARKKLRVLIAGGGPAGLEASIALRQLAEERVALTLLAPSSEFAYRPLAVAEPFGTGEVRRYDLSAIATDNGAAFDEGELDRVDPAAHRAHLTDGRAIDWDMLIVAVGARAKTFSDAVTVFGPDYTSRFSAVLARLEKRQIRRVAFVVPPGVAWALPLYELVLMTAAQVAEQRLPKVKLSLVTPEAAPLEIFGHKASAEVAAMLETSDVALHTGCYASTTEDGELHLTPTPADKVEAEEIVTLPVLEGPRIPGLPHDSQGFIPVDLHGLVSGETDVYAAGDATAFPIKQGGIATQEADAVAEAIAARAGAPVEPQPFRPILRGMLLTGGVPRYMRAEISGGRGEDWDVAEQALWWPPSKIAGRFLSPYLGLHHRELASGPDKGIEVEMDLMTLGPGFRRRAIIAAGADGHATTIETATEGGGQD
jgi:sulfide:quinone oxidoreductase